MMFGGSGGSLLEIDDDGADCFESWIVLVIVLLLLLLLVRVWS